MIYFSCKTANVTGGIAIVFIAVFYCAYCTTYVTVGVASVVIYVVGYYTYKTAQITYGIARVIVGMVLGGNARITALVTSGIAKG